MVGLMIAGLLAVGLVAVATPALAQGSFIPPGQADPVGLITSGAVLPFLGEGLAAGGSMSFLELYAPAGSVNVHMFLFDSACVRQGPSLDVELTPNDIALVRIDNIAGGPTRGLVTAAQQDAQGFTLFPWRGSELVAARTLWASSANNFVRVIDPIALATANEILLSSVNEGGWHPLRTGAAFFAPLEGGGLHTTIYFVCPNSNIQRGSVLSGAGGAFSPANGFPVIFPRFQLAGTNTPLRIRVYDDDEDLLRDVSSNCNCLTIRPVAELDPVYASAAEAPDGTYTEVEGFTTGATPAVCSTTVIEPLVAPNTRNSGNACPGAPLGCDFGATVCTGQFQQTTAGIPAAGPFSFVAYRAITVPGIDVIGRVPGASRCDLRGCSSAEFDAADGR
jgi:hypothetical protein